MQSASALLLGINEYCFTRLVLLCLPTPGVFHLITYLCENRKQALGKPGGRADRVRNEPLREEKDDDDDIGNCDHDKAELKLEEVKEKKKRNINLDKVCRLILF